MVAAGGMDYPQSIHRAYKEYLRSEGIRNGASRASMSKYIWLATKLGLIEFDHAEAVEYWDGVINGAEPAPEYIRESRPQAPSPRHYFRILDAADPRWVRLEASYRVSIGQEVPPPAPKPAIRPPVPKAKVEKPPKAKVEKPPRPARVPKPKPPTAAERVQPFEGRIDLLIGSLEELETTPTMEGALAIESTLLDLGEDVVAAGGKSRGQTRTLFRFINVRLRSALEEMGLLRSSVARVLAAETESDRAKAEPPLRAAIRVLIENLSPGEEDQE
ncbi:hypothetical protein LCGC14_0554960 [marine sediment metagenome]|uniref:Uncharacterized protein n=1 Tax=marine sediment metagenome TaxID=412755 RepID=A0A0F9UA41_9ZZZZ